MKIILNSIIILFIIVLITNADEKIKEVPNNISNYFPVNNNTTLVYKSSFGRSLTRYFYDKEFIISSNEADKFKYIQKLLIKDDGVYVFEVYQYLQIFIFIKKEGRYTYSKPLLRLPLPLTPGKEWQCKCDEYSNSDTNKVIVTGKVIGSEILKTTLGNYETIKVETKIESGTGKNTVTEWYSAGIGLVKANIIIEGGGLMGFARDILGYGEINFDLEEIKKD